MIALFLVVFVVGATQVKSDLLDPNTTKEYDIEARREILIRILVKLNETVKAQIASSTECGKKMNQTVDECNACKLTLCQPSPSIGDVALQSLIAGTNIPIVYAGKAVNDAAAWFQSSGKWLGGRAADYSRALGSTAETIGNKLENVGSDALSEMGSTFNKLGKDFVDTANKIQNTVVNPLRDTFLGLGQEFAGLENVLNTALTGTENAFNSALDSLKGIGSDIGDFFSDLFGKRGFLMRDGRCVQSCPVCDKIDKKKYTMDQILEKVCGGGAVTEKNKSKNDIQWLQAHSNYTYTGQNITQIDAFELTIVNMATLDFAFKRAKFTTDDGKIRDYPGPLSTKRKEEAGKKMGEIYFNDRWTNRN